MTNVHPKALLLIQGGRIHARPTFSPELGSTIGSTSFNSGNTYPSTYDTLGRRFAVSARMKF